MNIFFEQFKTLRLWGLVSLFCLIGLAGSAVGFLGSNLFWGLLVGLVSIGMLTLTAQNERFPFYFLILTLSFAEALRIDFLPSTLVIIPGALAMLGLAVSLLWRGKKLFVSSPILLLAFLLCLWATIATSTLGSPGEARPYWLIFLLLFLTPNLLTKKEHLLQAAWLFLLPLGVLGAYVFTDRLLAYMSDKTLNMEQLHLMNFVFGDKNIVGMWLTLGIPFTYYLFPFYRNRPHAQFFLVLAGIGMFLGTAATLSIGVAIGLGTIVLTIIWLEPRIMPRLRLLFAGVMILVLVFGGPLSERMQSQKITSFDSNWGTYRGEIWQAAVKTMLDYPIFGIGLDAVRRIAMVKYIDVWFIKYWYQNGVLVVPHNTFLSVGIETGFPGLLVYIALLAVVFFSLWRVRRLPACSQDPLLSTVANILMVALLADWTQGMALSVHYDKQTWFLMGCVIALVNIVQRSGQPAERQPV